MNNVIVRCLVGVIFLGCGFDGARADQDGFRNRLIYGSANAGALPALWEFDPTSGFTMGAGPDIGCMRGNLTFQADGSLIFPPSNQESSDCASVSAMTWTDVADKDTGTRGIEIADGDQKCLFATKVVLGNQKYLMLTTSCRQQTGQPRQFRYFLKERDGSVE